MLGGERSRMSRVSPGSHFPWASGEELGKVCTGLNFFPFLVSPYLYYNVDTSVGVDSVSGPDSFSLVFPPPALGSPPVCLQSTVCCKGEAGGSLGSDTGCRQLL